MAMRRYVGREETTMEQLDEAGRVLAGMRSKEEITRLLLEAFEEEGWNEREDQEREVTGG